MIKNIYSDDKNSAGTFMHNGKELKVFFPNGLEKYAEKCIEHFNNLSDEDMLEMCRGIHTAYKERNTIFARRFTIPRTKRIEDMFEYCEFESMEISGKYSEEPSYFLHVMSKWGHLKIIMIDGWKPCIFNNLDYKPPVVRSCRKITDMYSEGEEFMFDSGIFKDSDGRSKIFIMYYDDGEKKFAEKCAEHLRKMPDDMLETLCQGILNQYNSISTKFVLPELEKITDILKYCFFNEVNLYYETDEPAYIISGGTYWDTELGITIRGDKVLFVGGDDNLSPFLDEEIYKNIEFNDLYPEKRPVFPESGIYRIAVVEFAKNGKQYHYRCEDDKIQAGDTALARSGDDYTEVKVLDILEQKESELVIPKERYKFIIRKQGA